MTRRPPARGRPATTCASTTPPRPTSARPLLRQHQHAEDVGAPYQRYLVNQLRQVYGFAGGPSGWSRVAKQTKKTSGDEPRPGVRRPTVRMSGCD